VVRGVELDQPHLSLIALEDGTANWDISRESRVASREPRAMAVSLRRFEIKDGAIAFDNRRVRVQTTLKGLDQSLSGDFSRKQFTVQTRANADTVSVNFAGMPYLNINLGIKWGRVRAQGPRWLRVVPAGEFIVLRIQQLTGAADRPRITAGGSAYGMNGYALLSQSRGHDGKAISRKSYPQAWRHR
jgi:uncharacterized protein involved in outer membrane biogenesis